MPTKCVRVPLNFVSQYTERVTELGDNKLANGADRANERTIRCHPVTESGGLPSCGLKGAVSTQATHCAYAPSPA